MRGWRGARHSRPGTGRRLTPTGIPTELYFDESKSFFAALGDGTVRRKSGLQLASELLSARFWKRRGTHSDHRRGEPAARRAHSLCPGMLGHRAGRTGRTLPLLTAQGLRGSEERQGAQHHRGWLHDGWPADRQQGRGDHLQARTGGAHTAAAARACPLPHDGPDPPLTNRFLEESFGDAAPLDTVVSEAKKAATAA